MSKEFTIAPKPTAKPPMTLAALRDLAKHSEVHFNAAMQKMVQGYDYRLASVMADIQRRQDYFGPDSKQPAIAATFDKERKAARDKFWSLYEGDVRKHVAELRENGLLVRETRKVLANPKAVLGLSEIGSPRRAALFQELSQAGHAALKNAAAVAVSTKDATLGGVLLIINDGKQPRDRFLEPSSFAADIVGDQVAEADGLIRDIEAREPWASENWRSRDRNKPISATAKIQYSLRFGNEIPKTTSLTEADLSNAA